MTDNRTTERLMAMLEECGVKHELEHDLYVEWVDARGNDVTAFETSCKHKGDVLIVHVFLTPEQAIAATLGSEREKRLEKLVRIYGEIGNYFCERFACCNAEFANCKYCIGLPQGGQCELGWCNDESKALGIEQPDYGGGDCEPVNLEELYDRIGELENERSTGGTLTAEQVREAIEKRFDFDVWVPKERWQAIADELNAELDKGSNGECYLVHEGKKYPAELDFGFLGMMPIMITVGGFRYLVEVPNGE